MTDPNEEPVVYRDKRRLDPETGEVRTPPGESPLPGAAGGADAGPTETAEAPAADGAAAPEADEALAAANALADERLDDLQRLQAEYVNYRKRVDRDRDVAATSARSGVFEALLPVLDDVVLARTHGGLADGPAASIADKLEATLERLGLERYGEAGEEFDPSVHEALMHRQDAGVTVTTVTQVLQPGYKVGGRVLRAARVAVAGPA